MTQMNTRKGFGLLEVLLATAIFIVVVGSMVTLSRLALRNSVLSNHRTQAFNLSQEGLEIVRQMRDTNWIDGVRKQDGKFTSDETNEWKAFVHDCGSETGKNTVERQAKYSLPVLGTQYAICYDSAMPSGTPGRFGLKAASSDPIAKPDPDTYITVTDPNAPEWFRRTISFESVPATDTAFNGLQLMVEKDNNPALQLGDPEGTHVLKVTSTVEWKDFDKTWNVTLTTMLTNWQKN